jgi:hypothetical protein
LKRAPFCSDKLIGTKPAASDTPHEKGDMMDECNSTTGAIPYRAKRSYIRGVMWAKKTTRTSLVLPCPLFITRATGYKSYPQ